MHIVQLSQISPDQVILWSWGFITLNVTILYTWLVMAILVVGSWLVTRNLSSEINVSRWQHFLEVVISIIRGEISEMTKKGADHYIPLVGTLFLFICTSNVLAVVPGMLPLRHRLPRPRRWRRVFLLPSHFTGFRATAFFII
jgi:F-type H+-transporting ATPase subunit a